MSGMAKEKATITVDRAKAIDIALAEVIRLDRLRHDVAAYRAMPSTDVDVAVAMVTPSWSTLADDTDWDALYADDAG